MVMMLFFTYGVSLKEWVESGLLYRELSLYSELIKKGVSVNFVTYGDCSDDKYMHIMGGINVIPVYKYIYKPKNKYIAFIQSFIIPFLLKKQLKDFDVIKTNQIWGSWVAIVAKYLFKKPILMRCGFEPYKLSIDAKKSLFRRVIARMISSFAYKNSDQIWLTTEEISDFVKDKFNVSEEKIIVCQNWIDTDLFCPNKKSEMYSDRVLCVGRIAEEKNLIMLIHALEGTGILLDIAGSGPLYNSLMSEGNDRGVKINYLGVIANNKLPEIYTKYKVYVLCSHYEGNPKTLLEAMSCEVAVIGTDVPGIRSIIKNKENGIKVNKKNSDLRISILKLMNDDDLREKLGINARKYIIENNSLQSYVEKELYIYRNIKRDSLRNLVENRR